MTVPIRVLVVDDSLTVRKRIVDVLSADPALKVIGEGEDGKQAIELCERLRPDVVTLDMMMPVMTGVAAAEYIMAYCPTPILIVSASTNRGELFRTYDALAAGAIDVLDKPGTKQSETGWEERLRNAVKLVSRIKVITHPRARLAATRREVSSAARDRKGDGASRVIAIGGSTGSPGVIVDILRRLPRDLACPVLLVIHINEPFGAAFAEWLDGQSPLRVRYARDGERPWGLPDARVLMAPPERHLVLESGVIRLSSAPERHSCRPSVDTLFESVAADVGSDAIACLLTGMGRDGAAGLLAVRRAGGTTIAQDEATSVVFGMPREAILMGAAEQVLPMQEIGPALVAAARQRRTP
ncbi:MAG TPA: chemotaxis-specific protein-glutamate methyltransferase CheB [Anaeromyxobacteraceae bacterium]|nr:chemotaxis-specific protein-glutamate methyltransferase CheB [Anaeromyxobacteraceae bacterium]